MLDGIKDGRSANRTKTMPDMAYFSGTGPDGATCGGCSHFVNNRCAKVLEMWSNPNLVLRKISGRMAACKYWLERPISK